MMRALAFSALSLFTTASLATTAPAVDMTTIKSLPAPKVATDSSGATSVELWNTWGIDVANVESVQTLVSKEKNGVRETLRLVVTFNGMSTDMSPTHTVYLTYQLASEMSNITTAFEVANLFGAPAKIRRDGPGKYSFVGWAFGMPGDQFGGGVENVLHQIDATQLWIDIKARKDSRVDSDFDDGNLESSIILTRTAR